MDRLEPDWPWLRTYICATVSVYCIAPGGLTQPCFFGCKAFTLWKLCARHDDQITALSLP